MKIARVRDEKVQVNISKQIVKEKMTTGEAFRAISKGYRKSLGMSISDRKWDNFYDNFLITFRSIRKALQRLKEMEMHPTYQERVLEKVRVLNELSSEIIDVDNKKGDDKNARI